MSCLADHRPPLDLWLGDAEGRILHARWDLQRRRLLQPPRLVASGVQARLLALSRDRNRLYASGDGRGAGEGPSGVVSAFAVADDGGLQPLGSVSSTGRSACFLSLTRQEDAVLVANFRHDSLHSRGSVALLPRLPDGGLAPARWRQQHPGSGPVLPRQAASHPHAVLPSPDGRLLAVADLGIDRLALYRYPTATGEPERIAPDGFATAAGAAPRHLVFHPWLPLLYANTEHDATIEVFSLHPRGFGRRRQRISTRRATSQQGCPGDLLISPAGRALYCVNRGCDELAVFAIDEHGLLALRAHQRPRPIARAFALAPDGRALISADGAGRVTVHELDPASGRIGRGSGFSLPGAAACVCAWRAGGD